MYSLITGDTGRWTVIFAAGILGEILLRAVFSSFQKLQSVQYITLRTSTICTLDAPGNVLGQL